MRKRISFTIALLIQLILLFSVSASALVDTPTDIKVLPFTDVKKSDWFYGSVDTVYSLKLVDGKTKTKFEPNSNMTYAEAIKLAACMNELYTNKQITLKNGNPWYVTYVDYAKNCGIISDETIDYNKNISRENYAAMFAKALPKEALAEINNVSNNGIPDYKTTEKYGAEIYMLYRAGVLSGNDEIGSFCPKSNITRAEVCAVVARMMQAKLRVKFPDMQEKLNYEWVYGGYELALPHREFETLVIDGVKTEKFRYTGTYKDFGTSFRLLELYPDIYYNYGYLGMNIRFANRSDKAIKYMAVYVTPFNRVNDALDSGQYVTFTGPFYKPSINTDWSRDYYYWYNGSYDGAIINEGGSYYLDNIGYQNITQQQICQVYQVYHADDLWYDYYGQVEYLAIGSVKLQYMDGTTVVLSGANLQACIW